MIDSTCAGRSQSGLDIAPNPELSPRFGGSTWSRLYPLMSSVAGRKEPIMETIIACCGGLDVHKKSVEACVRRTEANGQFHQETRHWGTMTRDLQAMADWMAAQGVTDVAMESTGVYWKPMENLASWAGICPGNEVSAGKRGRRRIAPGNHWLKRTLAQAGQ
jgi:transposase IS116/IS110/IS902 family protein